MAKHRQWHIKGLPAFLLAPIAIPVIFVILLCQKFFGLKSTADLNGEDVASYLEDFLEGKGGEWDWDDFTSVPITDPFLEELREEAALMSLPLNETDRQRLLELLVQVKSTLQ